MQYTRPMIELVYEIRRRVDADRKPGVKMANPDLLQELAQYHQHTKDTVTKTLIKELLFLAGPEWAMLLDNSKSHSLAEQPKQVVKVYRGQTILVEAPHSSGSKMDIAGATARADIQASKLPVTAKPVRMYRGHPIIN